MMSDSHIDGAKRYLMDQYRKGNVDLEWGHDLKVSVGISFEYDGEVYYSDCLMDLEPYLREMDVRVFHRLLGLDEDSFDVAVEEIAHTMVWEHGEIVNRNVRPYPSPRGALKRGEPSKKSAPKKPVSRATRR